MKHYTIYEITEKLNEWRWSNSWFVFPCDVYYLKEITGDAVDCRDVLNQIYDIWAEKGEETVFFVESEGEDHWPNKKGYGVKIGMTNPAIEEYNLNRNIVI